jgi:hypothetical protein
MPLVVCSVVSHARGNWCFAFFFEALRKSFIPPHALQWSGLRSPVSLTLNTRQIFVQHNMALLAGQNTAAGRTRYLGLYFLAFFFQQLKHTEATVSPRILIARPWNNFFEDMGPRFVNSQDRNHNKNTERLISLWSASAEQ